MGKDIRSENVKGNHKESIEENALFMRAKEMGLEVKRECEVEDPDNDEDILALRRLKRDMLRDDGVG